MAGISRGVWQLAQQNQSGEEATGRPRASGVFITATGTEVGKTVVAAVLAHTLAADGKRVAVFKPAFTGMDEFPDYDEGAALAAVEAARGAATGDTDQDADADAAAGVAIDTWPSIAGLPDPAALRAAAGSTQRDEEIAPYRFDPPMSPHLAAGVAGVEVDPERVMAAARAAADGADAIVCEGAGGLLVPLSPSWTMRSCAVELGYPVVVVTPPGLGAINHTLLTVESARSVGLKVALIVINPWPQDPTPIEADNRETIAAMSGVPVLALPELDLTRPDTWPELRLPG
ncbi:MAG TPA: dethiobiotin synthase [Solirubrobacterales bacterium]|nr:dethiobiotin synthase [Solirubrobacterales bacterium]